MLVLLSAALVFLRLFRLVKIAYKGIEIFHCYALPCLERPRPSTVLCDRPRHPEPLINALLLHFRYTLNVYNGIMPYKPR